MKAEISKFLAISLTLTCILTFALLPQTIAAPQTPKIFVTPQRNVFSTETTVVGEPFTVSVNTSGWEDPGLYGYEFKLFFDPTLLNTTKDDVEYPDGHFLDWTDNFPTPVIINYLDGYILLGGILLGDVPGSTGDGIFATITFTIITAAPPTRSCDLAIGDISFLDPQGSSITDYDVEDGYYEFSPPKAPEYIYVSPALIGAATAGQIITVDIAIGGVREEERLVGVEWTLLFDAEFLDLIDVTEGNFLKSEAEQAAEETGEDYGTFFVSSSAQAFLVCVVKGGHMYFRNPWPPEIFPGRYSQSGTLATLRFNATKMPEELTETDLILFDVIMIDVDGNEILYDRVESGTYIAPAESGDLNYDNKINIFDLYIFGASFGSYPGHPRWDPRADTNGDSKVTILDGVVIAKNFHT